MKRLAIAIAAAALAVFLCAPAAAQQQVCGPYSDMTAKLLEYGEALSGRGIDMTNRMLEIWAGPDGWTVLLVRPTDMISCVMLIGQKGTQWQPAKPPSGPSS